ncbi:TetR/AcrR family transcriptional regulator [Nocardia blacklockiae]|uniref:TetR/AcrR family transcriptional regulator n=1 Tax=Nocardia blacklockiae TaxID=480036 RepID=UPI001895A8DF|nr:TetR/AcrR family transcriptional regulator [Nocardia blacklockiae]MBF6169975.1 TetR/AcrR family transcriptional regulator [Nocardia blacklockiae]
MTAVGPGARAERNGAAASAPGDVADRIARQSLAARAADYAGEVRRLLDAALELMRTGGTVAPSRVADIVAAAGLSNDAFYRHFKSKDALVAALLEDGTERLYGYVAHRMGKAHTPADRVRAWVAAIMVQADAEIAATTRAVLWNASGAGQGVVSGAGAAGVRLAHLLHAPFAELGSATPEFDASLAGHATIGKLAEFLWERTEPTPPDIDHIAEACLRIAAASGG